LKNPIPIGIGFFVFYRFYGTDPKFRYLNSVLTAQNQLLLVYLYFPKGINFILTLTIEKKCPTPFIPF